jgi:hypothetical protein
MLNGDRPAGKEFPCRDGQDPLRAVAMHTVPRWRHHAASAIGLAALLCVSRTASADGIDDASMLLESSSSSASLAPPRVEDAERHDSVRRAEDRLTELVVEYLERAFDKRSSTNRVASRSAKPEPDRPAAVDAGS